VATMNARGLQADASQNNYLKLKQFLRAIRKYGGRSEGLDVVTAQELNLSPAHAERHASIAKSMGMEWAASYGVESNGIYWGGVALIIVNKDNCAFADTDGSKGGVVRATVTKGKLRFGVTGVYVPAKPHKRLQMIQDLAAIVSRGDIVGGDMNCVEDVTMDVKSTNQLSYNNTGSQEISDLMDTKVESIDIHREQLGTGREYTRLDPGGTETRIDRFYLPEVDGGRWTVKVKDDLVWDDRPKDHRLVIAIYETIQVNKRGHDRQTVREELMLESEIQNGIIEIIGAAVRENRGQASTIWRAVHKRTKDYLLKKGADKRKKENMEIKKILAQLEHAQVWMNLRGPTPTMLTRRDELRKTLFTLQNPEIGNMTPERAKNCADRSDKCTRAMFKPFKKQAEEQTINKMKKVKGEWKEGSEPEYESGVDGIKAAESTEGILTECMKYYEMLFTKKKVDRTKMGNILGGMRKIPASMMRDLNREISVKEIQYTMENLPLGKQAGPDRIPNGVYKTLSKYLAPLLHDVIKEAMEKGELPKDMLLGDISLLHKKNERDEIRNYRPLTMLQNAYKIFTRVLAKRMQKVVHLFVDEAQKGFVPDTFIADCTMLLNMIENAINDDVDNNKGIFLFLDMEKAFDRVSYEYLREAMNAVGMEGYFANAVGLMYNEDNAPKRRIYANGKYSGWFDIRSGVAQGCPLSPLLFLLVAQGLYIAIQQEGVRGIMMGSIEVIISQFADDTTLALRSWRQLKKANIALQRWCDATGMKENVKKREGLAMGRYRHGRMPEGVKWVKEGEHAVSLGCPIGNDMDTAAWWAQKILEVRKKSNRWSNLVGKGFFGRNLIVQSMYFGRMRYWLYSMVMEKYQVKEVQRDATRLWWSRDPMDETRRHRRPVAERTARGPRAEGGLNEMDWDAHTRAFRAQWVTRYCRPEKSKWKEIWDEALLHDDDGKREMEGRGIFFCPLTAKERKMIMGRVPAGMRYVKECLKDHFAMDIRMNVKVLTAVGSESVWRNWRFEHGMTTREMSYFRDVIEIRRIRDLVDSATDKLATDLQWAYWIDKLHMENTGEQITDDDMNEKVSKIKAMIARIPEDAIEEVQRVKALTVARGKVIMVKQGDRVEYAKCLDERSALILEIDNVGKCHETDEMIDLDDSWEYNKVARWGAAVRGSLEGTFPRSDGWLLGKEETTIEGLTVKAYTNALQRKRFVRAASEKVWALKLGFDITRAEHNMVWRMKSFFATPRDAMTWLKLQHRNLYTVLHDVSIADTSCRACNSGENQLHLCECDVIMRRFWEPVIEVLESEGMDRPRDPAVFIAIGLIDRGNVISNELCGVMFIAWRVLYAEIQRSRMEAVRLDLAKASRRLWRMVHGRLDAYGKRWLDWSRSRTHTSRIHAIPGKYQSRAFIETQPYGEYEISPLIRHLAGMGGRPGYRRPNG